MKKKYVVGSLILIILMCALLFGWFKFNQVNENISLKNKIIEKTKVSDTIDFSQITDFKWDTMYIFTPYSKPENILKEDGVKNYNKNFNIEYLDNINMVAFVKSNKLVEYVELPLNYIGINIKNPHKFPSDGTKFLIYQGKVIY